MKGTSTKLFAYWARGAAPLAPRPSRLVGGGGKCNAHLGVCFARANRWAAVVDAAVAATAEDAAVAAA